MLYFNAFQTTQTTLPFLFWEEWGGPEKGRFGEIGKMFIAGSVGIGWLQIHQKT